MLPIDMGEVFENGISLGCFPYMVTTTLDERKAVLITSNSISQLNNFSHCFPRKSKRIRWIILLAFFNLIILCFFFFRSPNAISSLFFAVQPVLSLVSVSPLIFRLQTEKGKKTAKYHSAKHMVENAYKKLDRIPTLEEIKDYSRFSINCETSFYFDTILSFTPGVFLFFFFYSDNVIFLLVFLFIMMLWNFLVKKFNLERYLQFFVTSKPTDKELCVAIKCMQEFESFCENGQLRSNTIYVDRLP